MFAEQPLLHTSHSSNIRLPPINKSHRRRLRPPRTPSYPSASIKTAHTAENVSALKAKYAEYTTWLKTSTQDNREPLLTQELLKTSLCQMGIDLNQAEQLVSKCSWYVYQFQKNLTIDPAQKHRMIAIETRKAQQYQNKSSTTKNNVEESTTILNSLDKGTLIQIQHNQLCLFSFFFTDDFSSSSNSLPRLHNKHSVLPGINFSNLSTSSRSRHVDFGYEKTKNSMHNSRSLHPPSKSVKRRTLKKLEPIATEPLNNQKIPAIDNDSSSQRSLRQDGLVPGNLRSILRKQTISSPSVTSTDVSSRKMRSRALTPSSTVLDDMPLGTRSRRLFGGSECFAQIMNELEQQKKNV
ncbi:unnamed protein product [Rotaria socialis]|uniref:Uncharacterized protein n=1 Tax=Rotaria socialis TaxID=392032 RepID=A0A821JT34_9BILA|nr:unnamed protein product [Rotaria socialis]